MPEIEQVADSCAHSRLVVVEHTPGPHGCGHVSVDEDAGDVQVLEQACRPRVGLARQREDQPVDAALLEKPDVVSI